MSLTRKIVDGLLDKLSTDDTPLSHVDEAALEAELATRVELRKKSTTKPEDNPRAKHAGASAAAEKYRDDQAAKRTARVKARRARETKAREKADAAAFRRAQASAKRSARPSSSAGTGSAKRPTGSAKRSASAGKRQQRPPSRRNKPDIADHYKTLNLPPTASLTEAKRAFRKLMRKFHPDLAPANKKKAATEITMRITGAYKYIEDYHSEK